MQASDLQQRILARIIEGQGVSDPGATFLGLYESLDKPTTIQAFGRSVSVCTRRGWVTDEHTDDGARRLFITPEGELAYGGGVLSPQVNRDRWKSVREPFVGSSDVAAILGIHEYGKGPWDIWDRIVLGQWNEPPKVGGDIRRGNRQEQNAMDRFYEVYGLEYEARDMVHHPEHYFLVSDVDAAILPTDNWPEELRGNPLWETVIAMSEAGAEGALEVKCPRTSIFYDCRDTGLRTEYAVQMQHHLLCGGFDFGVFTLFDPQYDDVQAFPVTRHDNFLKHLEEGLPAWYEQYVVGRVRPTRPADPPGKWPAKVGGRAIEITDPKLRDHVEFVKLRYHELAEAQKNYDETEEAFLKALPEEGTQFSGDGVKVERKSSSRRSWQRKTFAAELKMAQMENDEEKLATLDPAEERFYHTNVKDKEEVTVFAKPEEGP